MISDEQQRVLLWISDLNNGWCVDGTGNRFKPIIIRNTRFLLAVFNDPTIDITPMTDGKSIMLTIYKHVDTELFCLSEDSKHVVINVYANKFTINMLDSNDNVIYQENYDMKQFINAYILA